MRRLCKFQPAKAIFMVALVFVGLIVFCGSASAYQVNNRSLNLASAKAGITTSHTIKFSFQLAESVGSIKFEYCTSPLQEVTCTAPNGIDASAATLAAQSGETGFVIFSQTANTVTLGRAPLATGTQANSYTLANVKNPSDIGSFYLRISSYASSDGSGPALDFGGTVGVITQGVTITTEVPPILDFCVGVKIPNLCDTATGNFLDLGTFHANSTTSGTTQFMVGTNANFGYMVTANGITMTSGNTIIPNQATPAASRVGQSQFGLNLRANTSPAVGTDPAGGSGTPAAGYNSPNLFKFNDGDVVAGDNFVSDMERYTVSYIVNISSDQPSGFYNTTLTYICTATF